MVAAELTTIADGTTAMAVGLMLGTAFNPIASSLGAGVAAAVSGYPRAPRFRAYWTSVILVIAWLAGDGWSVLQASGIVSTARDGALIISLANTSSSGPAIGALAVWIVIGLGLGYVAPTLVGVFVGRRVVRGTGWLSAAMLGGVSAGLVSALGEPVGSMLERFLG